MSSGFRKDFEWRRSALILVAAAMCSVGFGCASDGSVDDSKSNVKADGDDDSSDDDSADDDKESGDDDADDDAPVAKPDAKAPAATGKDAGTKPPTGTDTGTGTGPKTPGTGGSTDSLWCKAQPIIRKYCQDCHVEDAVGPMPLITVDDFQAEAPNTKGKKVYEVTKTRMHATTKKMPPQEILSAEDLKAVDDWIDDGAKPGSDPTCAGATDAPPPSSDEGIEWPPVGCENMYKILTGKGTTKATIAANAETHPQFVSDAPWAAGAQGLGFRPVTDNKRVLHHWIVYDNKTRAFINGWAPGKDASKHGKLPEDVGIYLPSGTGSIRLDVHYNNLGNNMAEQDQSGVEVCTTTKPRKFSATTFMGLVGIPVLPPGKSDTVGVCNVSVKQPTFIIGESPHAHKLARYMKLEHKRGGQVTMLHDAPFDFEEQVSRPLPEPFEIKTGDVLTTTCSFDNDTGKTVTFGENTGNEMCFNFISYYPKDSLSCGGGGGLAGLGGAGGIFGGGT